MKVEEVIIYIFFNVYCSLVIHFQIQRGFKRHDTPDPDPEIYKKMIDKRGYEYPTQEAPKFPGEQIFN